MLASEARVIGQHGHPVATVAGNADLHRFGRACGGRLAARRERLGAEVGGHVCDVLVAERGRVRVHGAVRAIARAVAEQGRGDVGRALAGELRHAVGRVDVLVVLDPVAAEAGVGEVLAARHVAVRACGPRGPRDDGGKGDNGGETAGKRHGEPPAGNSRKCYRVAHRKCHLRFPAGRPDGTMARR